MILITEEELTVQSVEQAASTALGGAQGALVTFVGTVRDHAQGHSIQFLEYSAYTPMAEAEMARIAEEAHARWPVAVAIAHRLGHLGIGQISIVVVVSSSHRREAFEACRWTVDEVKARVPIWKKEVATDGYWWVEDPVSTAPKAT